MKPETFSKKIEILTPQGVRTNQDHCTPRYLVEAIKIFAPIACDPCSNPWSTVSAELEYSKHRDEDGLTAPWPSIGLTYLNPPFGCIGPWATRCNEHRSVYPDAEMIMVCPFSPERKWWKTAWRVSKTAACWQRRIAWDGGGSSPPFATSILYWGPRRQAFYRWAMQLDCVLFALPRVRSMATLEVKDPRQLELVR